MFSYHETKPNPEKPELYSYGYRTADVGMERLAKCATSHVWSGIVWKEGRRQQTHFLFSDYCVLDIDEGGAELPLGQAVRLFCDTAHIIGTTKSHQKLKAGVVVDRYRVVFPWSERIDSLRVYRWNMQRMRDKYPLDRKALDGARYFFPCTEIVSLQAEGYPAEVDQKVPEHFESYECSSYSLLCSIRAKKHAIAGQLPAWVRDFLKDGKTIGDGRNYTIFRASIALFECGYPRDSVVDLVAASPFPRDKFPADEIPATVEKALTRYRADGGVYEY